MRALVTGADGFVAGWLVRELLGRGHAVTGIHRTGGHPSVVLSPEERARVAWRELDLRNGPSVGAALEGDWDAVVHLAGVSSGAEARQDVGLAWETNAAGSARLAEVLGERVGLGRVGPLLLFVSTAEVYGAGRGALRLESDPLLPCSPYAASKIGAEVAVLEAARRTGLRVIVARPFPHTGPGQDPRFVVPAFARRLRAARAAGRDTIETGNLDPVRELLDVRDVATAYIALLERGVPGQVYNVAAGVGYSLHTVLERLEALIGVRVVATPDPALSRTSDIGHLVGNADKLRAATDWAPEFTLDRTLQDLLDAQTD